jgi:apolipoprotein D and lipocalin family protein
MTLMAALLWLAPLMIQEPPPVTTVERVDLERYVGEWFEVARFPNGFQDHCVGDVRARYTRRPDGAITVVNSCREEGGRLSDATGVARVVDPQSSARLKVRFAPAVLSWLPLVWGDYWILGLSTDYSWAVVGSPDREYLWILARTPGLGAAPYDAAVGIARAKGFDVARLVKTPHGKGGTE